MRNSRFKEFENLYKNTIFIFESQTLCYQTFVAHGVREIINGITRDYKVYNKKEGGRIIDCDSGITEKEKITAFLKDNSLEKKDFDRFANRLCFIKDILFKHVHNSVKLLPDDQYSKYFYEFENILHDIFSSSFIERKREIEAIILDTPTSENIEKINRAFYYIGIKHYFYHNLTDSIWIEPLIKKNLITIPTLQIDENDNYVRHFWSESIYLNKIASQEPKQVFGVINLFFKKIQEQELAPELGINFYNQEMFGYILEISKKFSPEDVQYKEQIGEEFKKWLVKSNFNDCVNIANIREFLKDLFVCDQESLALEILEAILKLGLFKQEYGSEFKTKFHRDKGMSNYYYKEILEFISEDKILNSQSASQVFTNLYYVVKNAISLENTEFTVQEIDEKFCKRSAIEKHSQDQYKRNPEYYLVSALRDVAEYIFDNGLEIDKVINKLSDNLNDYEILIFTRIILHLLRKFPENRLDLISKYLTKENNFRSYKIHHEYYLLLQQEFRNLNEEGQKIILGFIDEGCPFNKDGIDDDRYQNAWRFEKLHCVKNGLFGKWKDQYQELGKKFKESKHPEFLFYMDDAEWVGDKSPIKTEEFTSKSIDEIVQLLIEWKPDAKDSWNGPSISGLADEIEKDAKKSPKKYLDALDKFQNIQEPAYISHLLRGLSKFNEKNLQDWRKIIDFGKIVADKDVERIESTNERNHFDREDNWDQSKRELIRIFSETFKNKDAEKTISISLSDDIFYILHELVLQEDFYLEQKEPHISCNDDEDNKYFIRAINSCHGDAVSAIVEYGLWLIRNKKENQASNQIVPILDTLIKNSKYQETWAIMGRYLPSIILIDEKWAKKNINNILPEDNRWKFDPAWLSYINLTGRLYNSLFELVRNKYLYVLEQNLYQKDLERGAENRISQHIAILYARKKIELEDKIISRIFDQYHIIEASKMIQYIGNVVSDKELSDTIITKFQKLWDWYIENTENHHPQILESFSYWYATGKFDNKWAIDNFTQILLKNPKITFYFFHVEEQLIKDITNFTKEISSIAATILLEQNHWVDNLQDFAKQYFKYLEENGTDSEKRIAIDLKNKFCGKYHLDENLNYLQ
jgi:hypothetical protein